MKKKFLLLGIMSLFLTNAFAQLQEVRGIETRLAIYQGEPYTIMYGNAQQGDVRETNTEYYGFELTNKNTIPISVTIEVYRNYDDRPDELIGVKDIVLESGEKYVYKYPRMIRYHGGRDHYDLKVDYQKEYYIRYKAYTLQ